MANGAFTSLPVFQHSRHGFGRRRFIDVFYGSLLGTTDKEAIQPSVMA
jgi:hypothetical protein